MKTISLNPPITEFCSIAQNDIKGSIPSWLINKISTKQPTTWIKKLHVGCEMIKSSKKNSS